MHVPMRRVALITALLLLVVADLALLVSIFVFGALALMLGNGSIDNSGVSGSGLLMLVMIEGAALGGLAWLTRTVWRAVRTRPESDRTAALAAVTRKVHEREIALDASRSRQRADQRGAVSGPRDRGQAD